ncbi:aldehyde oxidase [Tabrizicola sp. TH137]|uniref:molybdopterin-dependent oxidoreductase n=1 Tax=Tabrizicola sp. TH137 TaxID=2067452 RepID=UPI000C7B3159|nr:molybdopterin cofactor-binding domain-containing protein [Tabrizicola sp. TH137]PLL11396.1 aldehyde oxidase [Tabrizicola sp. TH137]
MTVQGQSAAVHFTLNGGPVTALPETGERLSHTLRETLGAREVKLGCNAGDCGACSVLVDGRPVCACLMPTHQAAGRRVETLKGVLADPVAKRLVQSFESHQAAQCGICTPGMMVAAVALLRAVADPTTAEVQDALGGVLCRCTGYRKIIDAVVGAGQAAAEPGGVGTAMPRIDGLPKITGDEAYGDDVAPPDALVVKVIRSPHPRAAFRFGDLAAWSAQTGLVVLTARDVPGRNAFGVIPAFVDQPVFAESEARFRGEAIAAVVGEADRIARFDPATFPVTWTPLPAVLTPAEALAEDAPLLHPDRAGNVMCRGRVRRGDAEAALAAAAVVVEGHFETGFVEHAYIEPEAGFARLVGDRLEIHACTQAPVMDQESMAEVLAMDPSRIRIVPTAVGGGFGSKLDISVQPFVALAALKTGRPARITYSRTESMQSTTKRHPSAIRLRLGATAEGRLSGMVFEGDFNTGSYASWGPTVANRVPVHASGPYLVPDYRAETRAIHTHCPPSGAFRGFGVPQSAVAQEGLFDELAARLGIDPLEFRLLNALRNGQPTVCGQVFPQGVGIAACLEALRPAYDRARAETRAFNAGAGPLRRGVGLASGWYGCGNTSLPNPSTIRAGVQADGTIVLHQGAMDIGQGANTVITQIFATALGAPMGLIRLIGPDTDLTPDAGKTSASRQTFVTGNAARLAGEALRRAITTRLNVAPDAALTFGPGTVAAAGQRLDLATLPPDSSGYVLAAQESYDPPTRPLDADGQGAPYAQFGYAAHLAVVEVDVKLGLVRPLSFTAAHDVGRAINPLLVEGQVQGGIAQGLGMALMEEYIPGRTENLHDYLIPTIGDLPPIETLIIEEPDAHGPYGAKGLGEHVLIPTAPAILNAIRDATGVSVRRLPVTPARLRAALKEAGYD